MQQVRVDHECFLEDAVTSDLLKLDAPARRAAASTRANRRRCRGTSPVAEMRSAASSSMPVSQPGSG
ncbi:hypothetical protein, partial [Planomonospora parontospora]|uniref:hypothetical protein n=1 Tax=Planomonospora parontospora TaxID=58119 RepID=UPI00194403AF